MEPLATDGQLYLKRPSAIRAAPCCHPYQGVHIRSMLSASCAELYAQTLRMERNREEFVDYFLAQVKKQPDNIAVSYARYDATWPYLLHLGGWRKTQWCLMATVVVWVFLNPPTSLAQWFLLVLFLYAAARLRVAYMNPYDELTFREVMHQAAAWAEVFRSNGLNPGDRVLLFTRPSPGLFGLTFGLMLADLVPVIPDVKALSFEQNRMWWNEKIKCKAVVAEPIAAMVIRILRTFTKYDPVPSVPIMFSVMSPFYSWIFAGRSAISAGHCRLAYLPYYRDHNIYTKAFDIKPERAPETAGLITFTTGSTGMAKPVIFTKKMMAAQIRSLRDEFAIGDCMGLSSVDHNVAFAMFEVALGMRTVIPLNVPVPAPAKVHPQRFLDEMHRNEPVIMFASAVVWRKLAIYLKESGRRLPSSLRIIMSGGAPMSILTYKGLRAATRFDSRITSAYGSTECLPIAIVDDYTALSRSAKRKTMEGGGICSGIVAKDVEVFFIDVTDEQLGIPFESVKQVPVGEVGEVCVRGDTVSPEYWGFEEANRLHKLKSKRGIVHRTGDLGYFDKNGLLWYCGRRSHRVEVQKDGKTVIVPNFCVQAAVDVNPNITQSGVGASFGVQNEISKRRYSALVGLGDKPNQKTYLIIEPNQKGISIGDDKIIASVRETLASTRWVEFIDEVVIHKDHFPVDHRHNSKIRIELLQKWMSAQKEA